MIPVVKDRLFFGRFEYCVSFHMAEVSVLRNRATYQQINTAIALRRSWRTKLFGVTKLCHGDEITSIKISHLHDMADLLQRAVDPYRLCVSSDRAWVYANNLGFLECIVAMPGVSEHSYSQVIIDRPLDTIRLKDSSHKRRSYFRGRAMTATQYEQLRDFLNNYQDSVRLSPSLTKWLVHPNRRLYGYFFVDHDDDGWLLMAQLAQPGLIRTTLEILSYK